MPPPAGQQQTMKFLDHDILRTIESIELKARLLVEGMYASRHRCPFYGYSVEFKDYREYVPGDEPRMIDWKLLGRTERYYVKRFEMESNMNVVSLLDISASMGYQPLDPRRFTKFEYGCYVAASLSYLASKQQDSPGLVGFRTDMEEFIPPKQGRRHMFGMLARLDALEPSGETDLEYVLKNVGHRLKRRCIIVLISDCHGDQEKVSDGLKYLAAQGHEVVVFHLLDADEVEFPFSDLTSFRDMETGLQLMCDPIRQKKRYMERLEAFRDSIRDASLSCGADYRFIDTSQPIELVLRDYLLYRRQMG